MTGPSRSRGEARQAGGQRESGILGGGNNPDEYEGCVIAEKAACARNDRGEADRKAVSVVETDNPPEAIRPVVAADRSTARRCPVCVPGRTAICNGAALPGESGKGNDGYSR